MDLVSLAERRALIPGVSREALHLEARDNYGVDAELFARWRAGDREEVSRFLKPWCDEVRVGVAAGKVYRRACVVSEPLSEHQCFMREVTIQASSEPNVVKFCADIFAGLWPLAIPHGEYRST
ncbi:DUF6879 family protein [Streptosporangium saharense]|uniref:DUF6879 domain-containing protein n=1 Tax=Streptosporangium saharense TaxID=1706840 RepID=A0A7W7QGM8_9ACTN|nr:DUF6879 family protein [Streptosporangium saharense]MBB4913250.1 hypothetical protein [Streptosporangium saharense]